MKRTASDQKPPLAPKPSVKPAAVQTDLASRLFVYQRSSPAVENKVKPAVAPKPRLFKIPPLAINSESKLEPQAHFQQNPDRNVGLLNFRNGAHAENNKLEWDYVIPIYVCNHENCADCVAPKDGNQKVLQRERSSDTYKQGMNESLSKCISGKVSSNKPQEINQIQNANPLKTNQSIILHEKSGSEAQTPLIHQKNIISSIISSVDSMPEHNECQQISSNVVHHSQFPDKIHAVSKPPRKNSPVAMQRKVKNENPNVVLQESTGLTRTELTVLPVDVNNSDLFTGHSRAINGTQNDIQVAPVPTPRKKIPRIHQNKNQDTCQSVDARETEIKSQNLDSCVDASANSTYDQYPVWRRVVLKPRPENSRQGGTTEVSVDVLLKKTKMFRSPLCEIKNEDCVDITDPEEKPQLASEENSELAKQSQPNRKAVLNLKPKSKSLSSVDMRRPDGLKKPSLLRIMDLDISVKKVPRLVQNGHLDTGVKNEQSVDTECCLEETQNQPCTEGLTSQHIDRLNMKGVGNLKNIGIEQSVDGDDLEIDAEHVYDHVYEDIVEYENLPPLCTSNVEVANNFQNQPFIYEDNGLYEYIDVYTENPTNAKEHQEIHQRNMLEEIQGDTHSDEDESSSEEDEENTNNTERRIESEKTKAAHIVNEILSSEKIFVNVLKLLHIDFREAVMKASCQAGKVVIDERVVKQILCSLPQLYELNRDLLKELEERVAHWDEHRAVADIFVKKGPYLKMYSTYIREFDKNVAILEEHCRKNAAFAKVVREFESDPRCANLAVKHYMLKPIQRIPQYQLLLTAYLNNIDESSPDYKDAEAALVIVKEVANHANEIVRQKDNFQKLYEVQCRLIGQHVIIQPGRILFKEGILMKSSRKVMQPRMFFLFNDSLLYSTPLPSGNFRVNNVLSLAGMKVSKRYQEGYHELNIESTERSFILSASSATCRDEWLLAISTAIEDYNKTSIRNPETVTQDVTDNGAQLGTKAPIWIPDQRATMCMICTCEFTLTWRRHHCRACGKVVCQACSNNKYPLKYLKNQLARVCGQCFDVLQESCSGEHGNSNTPLSPTGKSSVASHKRAKKIPSALKEVSANTGASSMSGYLEKTKGNKKQWRRFWFVILNKVLYTYAASEDVAALESQPLLGFSLKPENSESSLQFQVYHKQTLCYMFRANDRQTFQKWIEAFQEATVL
ncbi:FYVE, RhoGEF and PH domain-containing protein 6-like isoform X2 [Triplophysa rosa]|uniref:FYVE, RhoGEF and PH domain-containing protein 6-like isoform X2 n=1 Tax=Triplophysa rosa TaxID=992332 RepID=UPI002545F9F0|nr:FYVE, RhoGEF and PH domain-containing protein 6-like isoform X2 [Triplophysa rosa]